MGGRGEMPKERLSKKKTHGSHHQRLFEENVRKTKKKGLQILKRRVQELFTRREWQPLIECAKM